jgi:glycosyltransferase involved in cell wall biosynthesis
MNERLKILWLPAWYPSKVDFLNGDFVQRHALAVSKFVDVVILSVVRDESLTSTNTLIEVEEKEGLNVYTGYYNSSKKNIILKKIIFGFLYFKLLFKLYSIAKKKYTGFNLIHVHVSLRQGLFALWLKITKRINYVITEHNSWFMPIGNSFFTKNILLKNIVKVNFKYASAIHVVSKCLGNELKRKYQFISAFTVIPNVVDNNLFFYDNNNLNEFKTNFFAINGNNSFQKNTDGIIRAFSILVKKEADCILHIAGPNDIELKKLALELNLNDSIKFYSEIPNSTIATLMQKMDALIFFTRYETFGCVMAEALCCGKPVIASNLEILQENLVENVNALFVVSKNEIDLAKKLIYFTQNKDGFDNKQIAADALAKFNFTKVGEDFLLFYKSVLHLN